MVSSLFYIRSFLMTLFLIVSYKTVSFKNELRVRPSVSDNSDVDVEGIIKLFSFYPLWLGQKRHKGKLKLSAGPGKERYQLTFHSDSTQRGDRIRYHRKPHTSAEFSQCHSQDIVNSAKPNFV